MNRPTAQTFSNDVALLWLLKNTKTVYRSVLEEAQKDKTGEGLTTAEQALAEYAQLQSMILDTADSLEAAMTQYVLELTSHLVADSEFGSFQQDVYTQILANASGITEASTRLETLENSQLEYLNLINGQIRRGFLEDPERPGQFIYGIAVSQNITFTSEERAFGDGHTYYGIATGQTFGLYTSTGWQFWINGTKIGWFDSSDGKLHVVQQEVERDIQMGNWFITGNGGFGIKYTGG